MMKLGIYQHYNGTFYQVLGVARHSETLEEMVIYQCLSAPFGAWVRPREMFEGTLEYEGKTIKRFSYVSAGMQEIPTLR